MKFSGLKTALALAAGITFCAVTSGNADSVADFYKGKTIQIIVGFGAGGGYDLYARTVGRHLGRHIPGNPAIVVQNMAGAGSIRAANYVYGAAPQDGTVIAAVNQNASMYQLLGGAGARFDARKLKWLGSMTHSNGTMYTWHTSGIKTLDDAKKRVVPLGAVGKQSDSVIYPTIINALLGTKFKPIPGYTGTTQINLALERGEVMGRGGNSWASIETSNADWIADKKINILVQVGFEKEPELPNVPLLLDLVKSDSDKGVVRVMSLPTVIGYGHWVGPGVPEDRFQALRKAYEEMWSDPEFKAEIKKTRMIIAPQTGEKVESLVKQVTKAPKAILDRTARILKWK